MMQSNSTFYRWAHLVGWVSSYRLKTCKSDWLETLAQRYDCGMLGRVLRRAHHRILLRQLRLNVIYGNIQMKPPLEPYISRGGNKPTMHKETSTPHMLLPSDLLPVDSAAVAFRKYPHVFKAPPSWVNEPSWKLHGLSPLSHIILTGNSLQPFSVHANKACALLTIYGENKTPLPTMNLSVLFAHSLFILH